MKPYQSLLLAVSIFASATSMAQSPADTPASAAPTLDELNKQYLSEPDYSGKKLVVVQESYGDSSGSGALRYSIRDVGSERQHFAFSARNPQFLAGVFKLFFGDEQKVAMFRHLIEARQELDNDSKELQSALGFSVRVSEGDRNTVGFASDVCEENGSMHGPELFKNTVTTRPISFKVVGKIPPYANNKPTFYSDAELLRVTLNDDKFREEYLERARKNAQYCRKPGTTALFDWTGFDPASAWAAKARQYRLIP